LEIAASLVNGKAAVMDEETMYGLWLIMKWATIAFLWTTLAQEIAGGHLYW
jgi:hypothetical protein